MSAPEFGICGACAGELRYVRHTDGREIPADLGVAPGGPLVPVIADDGSRRVADRLPVDRDRPGFTPHRLTCKDPAFWHGKTDELERPRRNVRGVERGPCAGCKRPDHILYGPRSTGTLCAGCRDRLTAWRAAGGRGPLQHPHWKDDPR